MTEDEFTEIINQTVRNTIRVTATAMETIFASELRGYADQMELTAHSSRALSAGLKVAADVLRGAATERDVDDVINALTTGFETTE